MELANADSIGYALGMNNHLSPDMRRRLHYLISEGHLRVQYDEENIPQLIPSWGMEELTESVPAPAKTCQARLDPDMALLILAAADGAEKTPARIRQLRRLAGSVPLSTVLGMLA